MYEDTHYYSAFKMNMPNFFDSHAFYLCLFYSENIFKKFADYNIVDNGENFNMNLKIYKRFLQVQNKSMSLEYEINFYYDKNKLVYD